MKQKPEKPADQWWDDPPPPPKGCVYLQGEALDALVAYAAKWKAIEQQQKQDRRR